MATHTFLQTVTLVEHQCGECGVWFGMEENYQKERLRDHQTWYCPNGHPRVYVGETEEQRLKKELKYAKDRAAALQSERDQIEASRRAYKGQATRLRNRAIAGECPVCGQHLRDLARHMGRQHPDEKPEEESAA